ncbi:hypothetical protein [Sporofaciens musculi]|uniref:hypothetical protein n=1 Tax=Sporofaciens musculi TaxID=2681861 RepID=UPI0025A1DE77|nr:hypothetical protein [Sporofaciens musculi]
MQKMMGEVLFYYDREVVKMIIDKYGLDPMEAINSFICSETHAMLEDRKYGMDEFGYPAVFNMWECEKVTGNPRNSIYIRGE